MQMLYESDTFLVVYHDANDTAQDNRHNRGKRPRNGFEIVCKKENRELYLDGEWAALFQQQLDAWQEEMPSEDEVEITLESYAQLGWLRLVQH